MTEEEIKDAIRIKYGLREDIKLFTNPVGNGWMGTEGKTLRDGVLLLHPRRIKFGLAVGSSDLIGWITQHGIARFLALEVKTKSGSATPAQENFVAQVKASGGIAGIVRSVDDVEKLLQDG